MIPIASPLGIQRCYGMQQDRRFVGSENDLLAITVVFIVDEGSNLGKIPHCEIV